MVTKKQIILPLVILIIGAAAMVGFTSLKKPPAEKPLEDNRPIVEVSEVSITPLVLEVKSHGVVNAKYETELVAQVSGEVVELSDAFLRGSFIKKNQLLARIDPNDYQAALIEAQAAMATARAALETEVAQGKVAEREWQKITTSSPTELSLRKPQLAQELARVKAAQAAVLRAKRNLERTEIRAPYDAMINSRNIGLGTFVAMGTKIGHLLATDTAEVRLPVADNQLEFLANQGVNSKVILLGNFAGKETQWNATISRSEGVIDNKSRMSYLVAEFDDPYLLSATKTASNVQSPLRFGSYVNAKIIGYTLPQATMVPRYLVNNGKIAILAGDSSLHYAAIDIVREQDSNVIVSKGLADGDRLIISALDYPVDGMKLKLSDEIIATAEVTDADTDNKQAAITAVQDSGE
ncbi:efflux RND transporter periplasmic adaptor subunit [Colwellia echini]|uniref:Efflux RND transporter periplasmic adaptor subunit n=1 Tax=Colwellia echini TaxID=1982103 RepID=A0ABY3MW83_9GAMM|nr:efflux RND transporter periplasmic adaptor subunit [Colwellia echini]TYK65364.1 efflux RND transporter periplasmic adaptor subunit [Colwellia echini]